MPNLPLGEYRTVFKKIYSYESTNVIQYNFYFSKKTLSVIELKEIVQFFYLLMILL
ncbi:unnamed protein product [Aphis gossypii]|uniref:Uncharacterized protein n=1 Tax=Aphis gossypii TaxID=80765 RepID=A0A9P0J6S1_APHGO|nr:unnamed protein product [Aphis gossypii]